MGSTIDVPYFFRQIMSFQTPIHLTWASIMETSSVNSDPQYNASNYNVGPQPVLQNEESLRCGAAW